MKRLDRIRNRFNVPLYTFAEDYALSAGFLLLQMGKIRYRYHSLYIHRW